MAQQILNNGERGDLFRQYLNNMFTELYAPRLPEDDASATYTLLLADANKVKRFTAASPAVTIPAEASVNFDVGTVVSIRQAGSGTLVLTTTGLTINGTVPAWAQHVEVQFRKVGADTWDVV